MRLVGEKLNTRQEAERRARAAVGSQCAISKVERRQERCRAPNLYDLTGLQRDASTRAGLTAEDTLNALQSLYEKKLATYPRTESRYIGESDIPETARVLTAIAVPEIVGKAAAAGFDAARSDVSRVADDSKVHGHGAILPTALLGAKEMAALAGAERAVAILICCRLMAATMDPATKLKAKVEAEICGDAYTASGSTVTDASWIAVDEACRAALADGGKAPDDEDEAQAIPAGQLDPSYNQAVHTDDDYGQTVRIAAVNGDEAIIGVTVPTTFTQAGAGFFKIKWKLNKVRYTFSKCSANVSITDGNSEYSVEGAEYDIYRSSDNALVSHIVTDAAGNAALDLEPNQAYYAVETKAPAGYTLHEGHIGFRTGNSAGTEQLKDDPWHGAHQNQ